MQLNLTRSTESLQKQADAEHRELETAVNEERTRRVEAGTYVTVIGQAGPLPQIRLQGRQQDQSSLQGLATAAQLRIAAGDTATVTVFRDMDNVNHNLLPSDVLQMWQLGAAWVESVYLASWVLKDMETIPADFTEDSYWPS